ncbi:MAG: hypothetical protein AABX77_02695 [Nanoarchaeota archaeon]
MGRKLTKKIGIVAVLIVVLIILSTAVFYKKLYENRIEVDVLSLKSSIIQGEEYISDIKINNKLSEMKEVSFNVAGDLKDLAKFEKKIKLRPKEEKNYKIIFKPSDTGVFIGKLIISYDDNTINIPIILEVQSKSVWFDSNINLFPLGSNYLPGDKITSEVKIFDLADIGVDAVQASYYIKDFDGNTVVSDKENLVIDDKFEYSKSLNLPSDINLGSYVLINIINYKVSVGTSSVVFNIVNQKKKNLDEAILWVFVFFGFLVVLSLVFFAYFLFYRDKLLKELHGQYKKELEREKEIIRLRKVRDYKNLKSSLEKKIYKKEAKKVEKERTERIKEIYKKRLKRYKEIKKKGDNEILKKQLRKWKVQGYDTRILEKRFRMPNVNEIRKRIKQWKQKGYDTSILEKGV